MSQYLEALQQAMFIFPIIVILFTVHTSHGAITNMGQFSVYEC